METQVKETGTERLSRLRAEAKELGIVGRMTADEFEERIKETKLQISAGGIVKPVDLLASPAEGLTPDEAKKIEARLKYEFEVQEKFKRERQIKLDRASVIAESESSRIPIDLPENPTELELAKARTLLNIQKQEVKPSPETLAIEAGKRGYYIFTNREQDDASHTVNPGGKYTIHLIPDQVHVLSEAHIKLFRKNAVVPQYARVPTGSTVEGQMGERCERVGSKQRFSFEYLGEAPQEALFGLVTNTKILDELKKE